LLIVDAQVQDYREGCDAADLAVNEIEQQRAKLKAELAEVHNFCFCECRVHISTPVFLVGRQISR
jgi:hypothetical protein